MGSPLERKKIQAEFDRLRAELLRGPKAAAPTKAEMKAQVMAMVEAIVDQKLKGLRNGQGLGIKIRIEVVNSDLSFREEPNPANPRNSPEYAQWRKEVYERDKHSCVECGSKQKLQAHHIEHWAKHPALRYEVSNGRTLCLDCHGKHHPRLNLLRKSKTKKDADG